MLSHSIEVLVLLACSRTCSKQSDTECCDIATACDYCQVVMLLMPVKPLLEVVNADADEGVARDSDCYCK